MANVLANIFGSSPVQPLEKHIGIAYNCAKQLPGFFATSVAGDWKKARAARAEPFAKRALAVPSAKDSESR